MTTRRLISALVESVGRVPGSVPVWQIKQHNRDELRDRMTRFLESVGEVTNLETRRSDWAEGERRTTVLLTNGARAAVYHASGAMVYSSGMEPMEKPFREADPRGLEKMLAKHAESLSLEKWVGNSGTIKFEHLWKIKAAASDPHGKTTEPVLFRAVGAYRQFTKDVAVWGPASAALKVAGNGEIDSLALQVREPFEAIDEVESLPAEKGAADIVNQLLTLMGVPRFPLDKVARPRWMRFGYLGLSKRKSQRVLEPVYVAQIDIEAEDAQGYLLVAPAAERVYESIARNGQAPLLRDGRKR